MKILIITVSIWVLICVVCLIKYLQFNKRIKQAHKKQNGRPVKLYRKDENGEWKELGSENTSIKI